MCAYQKKDWPQIKENTGPEERAERIRSFEIKNGHTTFNVKGRKTKVRIIFKLSGYSKYIFALHKGELLGKKTDIERVSDTGILSHSDNRFNLINDKGRRVTVRLGSLIDYLPKAFV